jgi:hypothetical protein
MSYAAANAAREAQRANPNSSVNGPWMMSQAAQQAQRRQLNLLPTAYLYDVPQVKSSKCNLCLQEDNHGMADTFVGHDAPVHRHLMCLEHYQRNKRLASDRCPECRVNMGEWQRPVKVVRIAADGTETVIQQPGGGAVAASAAAAHNDSGGKKRKRTRGRRLRRRHSFKKSKKSK